MTVTAKNFLFQLLAGFLLLPLLVKCASIETVDEYMNGLNMTKHFPNPDDHIYVIPAVLSIAVIVVLAATVLFLCGDCHKSEVSSSNHAACGGNKLAAGDSYHVADTQDVNVSVMQSSRTFGEVVNPSGNVVNPSGNQALPYSMTPTHIETQQEFVGYESTPQTNLTGYSGGGVPQVNMNDSGGSQRDAGSQRGAGSAQMHVNPMDNIQEEPPPSYNEAIRTGR